jgi:1-acyl-sn-glycerol-3-phosphate acyltransferase
MQVSDFPTPYPCQFKGSALAHKILALLGWRVYFEGFPALQGVLVVYPHTSNWDAPIMFLAKWAMGVQATFWGKDSLFKIPLLGAWLRWIGGIPVNRTSAQGIVTDMVDIIVQKQKAQEYFWLGLAPEGTRKRIAGWRSGFYQAALRAQVPLGLIKLDYARREISIIDFIAVTGNVAQDMARIAQVYEGVRGLIPANAAPVLLLDAAINRSETVVK